MEEKKGLEGSVEDIEANIVRPVTFLPIEGAENRDLKEVRNLDILLELSLMVSVELGRTQMTVKEALSLGKGSVIKLEKLAGEPADLYINGKLVARGEVVVVDESFGIKITEIIGMRERVESLGGKER